MKILKTKKYSILSNILKYGFIFVIILSIASPFVVRSACGDPGEAPCTGGPGVVGNGGGPGVVGNDDGTTVTSFIENPLSDKIDTIPKFIEAIIEIVMIVGIPIVVLAIIYTGFLFVAAQGNPEKLTKAKKALLYTLIGAVLLLGAFVIANAIGKTVDEIKKTG